MAFAKRLTGLSATSGAWASSAALRVKDLIFPFDRVTIARMAICGVFGSAIALILVYKPDAAKLRKPDPNPPVVRLLGKPLPMTGTNEETLNTARGIVRAYIAQPVLLDVPGGVAEKRTRADLGARVDNERLTAMVEDLRDPESPMRRGHAQLEKSVAKGRELLLPLPVVADEKSALSAMMQVKDAIDKEPIDARLDLEHKRVLADEVGRRLDVYQTLARLDQALLKGDDKITAAVTFIPATRTADSIKNVVIDDVLGYFETKYAKDLKHEARSYNLRLAASHLDGHVIFPGETFDFNDVVGPRNEANGYRVAPVIASGELVDGIGGGTCQVAGTLHGAAYFSGLDIVERHPHTRPSFYIKMGMDATVVYPTITLKLRNPFTFPVVLHETVEDGFVHAEILGPKRTRDVTFVRKVNEVVPFQERDVQDPKVPKGERMLAQRGIPGFKITRYRILRDGSFAVRERSQDVYPPTAQIWKVGQGETDPKWISHDDEHPEYVADEYLQISQGPDIHDPRGHAPPLGGSTVETRVAGKYGTHGWTVREGFAKAQKGSRSQAGAGDDDRPGVD